ncbi:MAG: UDP-N-acetylmuramoyl-tripeptide--D-alanyl-D-alanine ligase [Patescibacteria group bacterium]
MKKFITTILILEAKAALAKHGPKIVGITGSVGKSSSKEFIFCVLSKKFRVRQSPKSYNSEIGLALSILGLPTYFNSNIFGWSKNIIKGFFEIWNKKFPEILVLEMGIDRPKDMDNILKVARPNIAVITAIGEIPAHVEFFAGPEDIAREKSKILKYLLADEFAFLNFDDDSVWSMREKTKARVLGFGFGAHANFLASNLKISISGATFKIDCEGSSVPVHLQEALGKQNIYAALSAFAVGSILGFNLVEISEYLSTCKTSPGRMKLLEGIKNSKIIDDTYNSSPQALHAALDALEKLDAVRKVAILGDMLEIGKYTIEAHKTVGQKAHKFLDVLVTVGLRAKFISAEALTLGMEKNKVYHFSTPEDAFAILKDLVKEGDLILVKGSQAMRMERIVEEIMQNPENAPKLLVRQEKYWKNKK